MLHSSRWTVFVVAIFCLGALAVDRPPSTEPSSFRITGIDGKSYEPLTVAPHRAAVLFFVLQDCPICNSYAPQIERLAHEFAPQGAAFYLVHVDSTLTRDAAVKHAKDYGYTIPVVIDRHHDLVNRLDVDVAPTAVVLGTDGQWKYKGRVDDLYAGLGKPRTVATTHELRDAIEAVLAGKPVAQRKTISIGCAVPDIPRESSEK